MSMSTHVVGFRPPDDRWRRMKAAWDACEAAGIPIPEEVEEFFGGESPDPQGVEVRIEDTPACVEWQDDMRQGYEIHVTELPPDVTIVRVYNSW